MKALALVVALVVLMPFAQAALIQVTVTDVLDGRPKPITTTTDPVFRSVSEFYNAGSIGFAARERIDISQGQTPVYTGWSTKEQLPPGSRATFDLHWHANRSGTFTVRTRYYYAQEIEQLQEKSFTVNHTPGRDVFTISGLRVTDQEIRFTITASEPASGILVLPHSPTGWIIAQIRAGDIAQPGGSVQVILPYETDLFTERPIAITLVTEDGRLRHDEQLLLRRETGFRAIITALLDAVAALFS